MKHIKKFNETKKDEKVKDQEVLFNAEVLVDKDEKPSFKTGEQEDQEKVKKEFDKLTKVKKFEAFIDVDIHIDNIDEVERCVKSYAKQYQYRKYKEVYKANINMLKDLINDCGEFNEKTNLKIKWKSNKQNGGNHYIAIFRE